MIYSRIALTILVLLACAPVRAQVITGTVLGTVTDQSGGAVVGAQVTITNSGTGVVTRAATNSAGEFTVPYLQPGVYEVAIEAAGFKTFRQSRIELTLDSKVRVDARLDLGNVTESVQVTADAVTLQTDSSDVNRVISQQTLESLPNIGKNPLYYLNAVAGIVAIDDYPDAMGTSDVNRMYLSRYAVNGSRTLSSEFLLDGAPNTSTFVNEIAIVPNTDAIGDMKVITSAYSAEFGRVGGAVVMFGTKSGTNEFHGSLYEYWRNPALNANTFGNNSFGRKPDGTPERPKGKFNMSQFGGTFQGPVNIPKLYHGRNKTFFFVSYEAVRRVDDASGFYTVPTELERRGDFTQSRSLVRDPATGRLVPVPRNVFAPFPATTSITAVRPNTFRLERQQFQDGGVLNKIPRAMINPVAQRMINAYPLPNISPLQPDGTENYFDSSSKWTRTDQIIVKLDHNASERHRSFFRYTTDWTLLDPPDLFRNTEPLAGFVGANQGRYTQFNPSATVGYTFTASPTSLFDFRANLTRLNHLRLPGASGAQNVDLAALGFAGDMVRVAPISTWPCIFTSGYPAMGACVVRNMHSTNVSLSGNWTKIRPKWTHKLGGEFRNYLSNFYVANYPSMSFTAGKTSFTRSCAGSDCPTLPWDRSEGFVLADFLIGNLDSYQPNGQFTIGEPQLALGNRYLAFFSQNDWKATRKLTINLGFRWDYQGPLTERYDRLSQFDRGAKNLTGTPGQYVFSGHNGLGRGQMDPDYRQFAPRLGFAYRLDDKTVVRSAYGITFDMTTGIGAGGSGFGINGFQYPAYMRIRPVTGLDVLERPFNDAFNGGGSIVGRDPAALVGSNVVAFDRRQRTPYLQQWNFTIERKLPGFHLSVGYVGSKGTRLAIQDWQVNGDNSVPEAVLNGFRDEYIRTGVNPAAQVLPNPFYGTIPAGNPNISGPNISRLNLNRAFPAFGSVAVENQRLGSSSYNALQVTARRPFSKGFEVSGTYTWAKNIDFGNTISGGQGSNAFTVADWNLQRSVSASDVPHRATLNYVWELPFGKGKPWLTATPVLSQLAGGWKLGGLTTWSAGFPLAVSGGYFGRPDLIGNPVLPQEYRCFGDGETPCPLPDGSTIVVPNRRMLYFNPKAYYYRLIETKATSGSGTIIRGDIYWYGNAPRYNSRLRYPGIDNYNMSLTRTFAIREGVRADLRVDAYNAFNRTQFAGVATGFGGANFDPSRGPLGFSTNASFGTLDITSQGRVPRYMQVSLKVAF